MRRQAPRAFPTVSAFLPLWLLAACAAPAGEAEPARRLVGRWEPAYRHPGGLGTMLELMADGTAVLSPGMRMIDFDYRLDGNRLVLTGREESGAPPVVMNFEVRFDGAALVQKDLARGVETRMRPVGKEPPGGSTLVGAWRPDLSMQDLSSLSLRSSRSDSLYELRRADW